MKTADQAENLIDECDEQQCKGTSRYSGMTYEEGIIDALAWVFSDSLGIDVPEDWPFSAVE